MRAWWKCAEGIREAAQELAAAAQHLDHAGRDRALRGELTGDQVADVGTCGEGEVDWSVPAPDVEGRAVHADEQLGGTEARRVGGRRQVRSVAGCGSTPPAAIPSVTVLSTA